MGEENGKYLDALDEDEVNFKLEIVKRNVERSMENFERIRFLIMQECDF